MDWTAVFVQDGNEDLIIDQIITKSADHYRAPRISRLISTIYHPEVFVVEDDENSTEFLEHRLFDASLDDKSHGEQLDAKQTTSTRSDSATSTISTKYTLRSLYFLSINYILGVGCLGIPYAFARAGFIMCCGVLFIVTLFSYMTVMWVAETGVRFEETIMDFHNNNNNNNNDKKIKNNNDHDHLYQHPSNPNNNHHTHNSEQSPLVVTKEKKDESSSNHDIYYDSDYAVDRYEVIDLVGFYLGSMHQLLYKISLMALMYIGLLAYSQVFCGAVREILFSKNQNNDDTTAAAASTSSSNGIPQLLFGIMVIPLSCMDLEEQVQIQSLMAGVRFLAIFIMVFGSGLALWLDDSNTTTTIHDDQTIHHHPPYFASPQRENCQMSYTFCLGGFGIAFSTCLFSQLFQHSVPGLLRPLFRNNPTVTKKQIPKVPQTLAASLLTTSSFYLLLGFTAASFFGANTRSSVNLNFANNFYMGLDPSTTPPVVLTCIRLASNVVVLFPALDTISVFPLIANTLGNNLYASSSSTKQFIKWLSQSMFTITTKLKQFRHGICDNSHASSSSLSTTERIRIMEQASQGIILFWRFVAAIPPLLASLVAADLSFSMLLAGVAGVYVAFFAPSLLHLRSSSHSSGNNKTIKYTVYTGWYTNSWFCYPVLVFASFSLFIVLYQIWQALMQMH